MAGIPPRRRGTIFVHIGTHKTGSTSIQHFLTQNADDLRAAGILIPAAGRYLHGHHHIAWELRNDERLEGRGGCVQGLLKELRQAEPETAVVSSEDFEYLSQYPAIVGAFSASLREIDFEPVFVVFFRERRSYLASLAAALANHGVTHTMEWYDGQLDAADAILVKKDWFFDFNRDRFVSRWSEIAAAAVVVHDYDACTQEAGVVPAFLETIGAGETLIERARSWPRLNVRGVRPHGESGA